MQTKVPLYTHLTKLAGSAICMALLFLILYCFFFPYSRDSREIIWQGCFQEYCIRLFW